VFITQMKSFREFHISLSSESYKYIVAHLSYNLSLSCAIKLNQVRKSSWIHFRWLNNICLLKINVDIDQFISGEHIKLSLYMYVFYHSNSLFEGTIIYIHLTSHLRMCRLQVQRVWFHWNCLFPSANIFLFYNL